MVGAGVIRRHKGRLTAAWVPGSFVAWRADVKQRKRKDTDDECDDYHGNFNAPKFESWFESTCSTLRDLYGPCRIHLDGASYHKRRLNSAPTGAARKQILHDWLVAKGIPIPPNATKVQLLELIRANKEAPVYASTEIAVKYSHMLFFTPPYHPELQPIEMIWGVIKNGIASDDPVSSMNELLAKVNDQSDKIRPRHWLGAYAKVQEQENAFNTADDDHIVALDTSSSESESESDESEDEQV